MSKPEINAARAQHLIINPLFTYAEKATHTPFEKFCIIKCNIRENIDSQRVVQQYTALENAGLFIDYHGRVKHSNIINPFVNLPKALKYEIAKFAYPLIELKNNKNSNLYIG